MAPVKLSVLDLAHVPVGIEVGEALRNTLDLARHADALGYERYWLAEHHNMPGIASAATSVVIGQVAAATQRIRVGAGGIMLPNHSPLVIAEQFGTLDAFFPGRIDLGLGRAPGTDGLTWRALRRDPAASDRFPEGRARAAGAARSRAARTARSRRARCRFERAAVDPRQQPVRCAARRAVRLALCLRVALRARGAAARRSGFIASASCRRRSCRSHTPIAGVNVICADTDEEARRLFTSLQEVVIGLVTGNRGRLAPPVTHLPSLSPQVQQQVDGFLGCSFVGSPATVREQLEAFVERPARTN